MTGNITPPPFGNANPGGSPPALETAPALGSQAPRRPDLVRLRPLGLRLGKAFFEHLADGHALPRFDPRSDDFFPGSPS